MRLSLLLLGLLPALAHGQVVAVTGGKHDAAKVVVTIPVGADAKPEAWETRFKVPAQIGNAKAPAPGEAKQVVLVLNEVKANASVMLAGAESKAELPRFKFVETKGEYVDVLYGDKPVMRYVDKPRDGTTKDTHYMSFKPFHQVFDPAAGKTLLSSGAHPLTKDFLYPHHRGIYFGFNKISYGDKQTADIWHGTDNVYSTHDKMLSTEAGPVFARHTAAISWHGKDGKTFAEETRNVTVYHVDGGTMIDWSTALTTTLPKVRLDGDPQHAGFHFRATQDVAKSTAKQTYYLRPDGKGKEGETRNWAAGKPDPKTVNLPWNAMCFVVDGKRFTALRINHPDNPGETRGSERDYGRFGDYFEYDLTPEKPLKLQYRVWVQEGEMTKDQCERMAAGFTERPAVKVMQ